MTPLARVPDWEARFAEAIERARKRPFAWGQNDCVLFAASVVAAITGVDLAAGRRGTYRTALGAARVARSVEALAEAHLGPRKAALLAQRGDVVMFLSAGTLTLGVCCGPTFAAVGREGLVFQPIERAVCAWSV